MGERRGVEVAIERVGGNKKNNNVKCTTSINWREFAWKTMIHFFRVPSQNVFTERDTLLEKIALK